MANIPTNTVIRTAISEDGGQTWQYYNGTAWVIAASQAEALANGASLINGSLRKYALPGITNKTLSGTSLMLAFNLISSAANISPFLHNVKVVLGSGTTYSPMLITSYTNPLGEIGLSHSQGSYSSTKIKNKLNEPIAIRMKVYDGALAS